MPFQNPPLWVWAIIAAVMIASKFIYRWYSTKKLAKESEKAKAIVCVTDRNTQRHNSLPPSQ